MNETVLCEKQNDTAIVTINRPEVLNALNPAVLTDLYEIMDEIDRDRKIKTVILTGSGSKAFAAGADIAAIAKLNPEEARAFADLGHRAMNKVSSMHPFVIAAVNGYALGGGCELAMACDIRIASSKAKMGLPEAALGVIPGFGGTQRLPRLVGVGKAKELLATGRQVRAEEALRIGLVNDITEPENLLSHCLELAQAIAKNSANAIYRGKQAIDRGSELPLDYALALEKEIFSTLFATHDQKEGMDAFLNKRTAVFE